MYARSGDRARERIDARRRRAAASRAEPRSATLPVRPASTSRRRAPRRLPRAARDRRRPTDAASRFDTPRKPATNAVLRALVELASASPSCSMRPSFMTAIASAIVIASSWSCVTWTNVMPTSCWIRFSSSCICLAQLQVERAERLVEQQHARLVDERPRERDPLLLAAGELARLALAEPVRARRARASRRPARSSSSPRTPCGAARTRRSRRSSGAGRARSDWNTVLTSRLYGGRPVTSRSPSWIRAGRRLLEAADHAQRRRLAAAGRPEQREELPRSDLERRGASTATTSSKRFVS